MAQTLPYLPSYKNIEKLFKKIEGAKIPDSFSQKYLYDILGLKSIADRALITLLKTLGFLDNNGSPTKEYSLLKNPQKASFVIGDAIKKAYAPLFSANENVQNLSQEELKGLVAQIAGTEAETTKKIVGTFNNLKKLAKFNGEVIDEENGNLEEVSKIEELEEPKKTSLKPQFHYNIQIHLPSNASEETYLNIFNALRRTFE